MSNMDLIKSPRAADEKARAARRTLAIGLTVVYAIIAVLVRLIPYGVRPPNVAANGSLSVFGGARTPIWVALPAQLLVLTISDAVLNQVFAWRPFTLSVYISFIIYMLLGRWLLRGHDSVGRIAGVTFLGSLQFFLITNFFEWFDFGVLGTGQREYETTLAGLLACYWRALPFFGFTLAGDLGFGAAMFGAEAWLYGVIHGEIPAEVPEEAA